MVLIYMKKTIYIDSENAMMGGAFYLIHTGDCEVRNTRERVNGKKTAFLSLSRFFHSSANTHHAFCGFNLNDTCLINKTFAQNAELIANRLNTSMLNTGNAEVFNNKILIKG
jgi:hypothetical protein